MAVKDLCLLMFGVVLLAGCSAPQLDIRREADWKPAAYQNQGVYVAPFPTVMVPKEIGDQTFDEFVDLLTAGGVQTTIIKQDMATVDPVWLQQQYYIDGEIFGFVHESGCCATDLRLKARVRLHQPGSSGPSVRIDLPRHMFFDHDVATLEQEQQNLVQGLARELADTVLRELGVE